MKFISILLLCTLALPALADSSGVRAPATITQTNTGNLLWNNPSLVKEEDGFASGVVNISQQFKDSEALRVTNFGFSIPAGATIQGVKLELKKRGVTIAFDDGIYLIRANNPFSANRGTDQFQWPESFTYISYGGPTDLWDVPISAADVNDATFGAQIVVKLGPHQEMPRSEAYIDVVRMTVFYTPAPLRRRRRPPVIAQTRTPEVKLS